MTVTEVAGQLGTFEIPLRQESSGRVLDLVWDQGYRHVAVLNKRRGAHSETDDVRPMARYVGVIDAISRSDVSGVGLAWYLADDQGRGYPADADVALEDASLAQWVMALCPPTLTLGTITPSSDPDAPATWTGTWRRVFTSRRGALDFVCAVFRVEWRISTMGVLTVGPVDALYGSTPRVLVSRDLSGRDRTVKALKAPDLALRRSMEEWYSDLFVCWWVDDQNQITTDYEKGSPRSPRISRPNPGLWTDLNGSPVQLARYVDRPANMGDWAVATWASAEIGRAQLDMESIDPGMSPARMIGVPGGDPTDVAAGEWVMVWDPDQGIVDPGNPQNVLGHLIHPWTMRCSSLSWPVVEGMGLYLWRTGFAGPSSIDITDMVALADAGPATVGFAATALAATGMA